MADNNSKRKPIWFFHPPQYYAIKLWLSHYFGGLYERADRHHIFLNAGGLSFSLFVCVVPIILVLFAVLGAVLEKSALESEIVSMIDRAIPYETYNATVKQFILDRIYEFRTHRKVAGLIGAIGLLFAASGLFSSMRTILNNVFSTRIEKHVVIGKLRDLGMILFVMAYVLISVTLLPIMEVVKDSASSIQILNFIQLSLVDRIFIGIASFLLIYLVFFSLYSLIPYEKLNRRVVFVSAFWATLLWEIARQAFGYYITHMATLKAIYGTYLFLIVVAFWFYYTSVVFILGAEIGQLYKERRK